MVDPVTKKNGPVSIQERSRQYTRMVPSVYKNGPVSIQEWSRHKKECPLSIQEWSRHKKECPVNEKLISTLWIYIMEVFNEQLVVKRTLLSIFFPHHRCLFLSKTGFFLNKTVLSLVEYLT